MLPNETDQREGIKVAFKIITKRTSAQDGKIKAKTTFYVSSNETDDSNNVWFMRD